jgi:dTDP-4-dehydrorhamnose 3,5-epimerase
MLETRATKFPEALVIAPDVFADERGYFKETYSQKKYEALGISDLFVQDNVSYSGRGVLRGMHYDFRMAKLVQCLQGRIFDVIVDVRRDSPTYLQWQGFVLTDRNHKQVYVPAGFAHGFLALDENVVVHYKNSVPYDPVQEGAVLWRNPRIGVQWPLVGEPRLSAKDAAVPETFLP